MFSYPNFKPQKGNLTIKIINEYIKYRINNNTLKNDSFNNKKIINLVASNDINDELYFWQLYSILGKNNIHKIIETFYIKIFNNKENNWFSNEFIESGNINYHINMQKNFWLDIMGGGINYNNELLLNRKHYLVKNIMTEEGANIWIKLMLETLNELNINKMEDKRIIICLEEFLNFFMIKYSKEFNFYYNSKL